MRFTLQDITGIRCAGHVQYLVFPAAWPQCSILMLRLTPCSYHSLEAF